jgi:hypothetical protein
LGSEAAEELLLNRFPGIQKEIRRGKKQWEDTPGFWGARVDENWHSGMDEQTLN